MTNNPYESPPDVAILASKCWKDSVLLLGLLHLLVLMAIGIVGKMLADEFRSARILALFLGIDMALLLAFTVQRGRRVSWRIFFGALFLLLLPAFLICFYVAFLFRGFGRM